MQGEFGALKENFEGDVKETNEGTVRVLHTDVGEKNYGGVPAVLLALFPYVDHSKFTWDFLSPAPTKLTYDRKKREIESTGGHIYSLGIDKATLRGKFSFPFLMKKFLRGSEHTILHINTGSIKFQALVSWLAKHTKRADGRTPLVVCHSHSSNAGQSALKKCLRKPLKLVIEKNADLLIGCSEQAAYFHFRKKTVDAGKVRILKNGIETERFAFDPSVRDAVRRELGVEDRFVIGHAGRLSEAKNHTFLLDVFAKIREARPDAVLVLAGGGELERQIREKIETLQLSDKVLLLGARSDVERIYQAFDIFIFPSLFEGLGIVVIEAQTSGLPCLVSEAVPEEAVLTDLVKRLPLSRSAEDWAKEALDMIEKSAPRTSRAGEVAAAGYDARSSAKELEELYKEMIERNESAARTS